jgi:endogenous inhibitor of DNA gyrase (YacG/DUF329 family)
MSQSPEPRCPICSRPRDAKFRPFCSKRCADVDLARWFRGGYAIPAVENDDSPSGADGDANGEGGPA